MNCYSPLRVAPHRWYDASKCNWNKGDDRNDWSANEWKLVSHCKQEKRAAPKLQADANRNAPVEALLRPNEPTKGRAQKTSKDSAWHAPTVNNFLLKFREYLDEPHEAVVRASAHQRRKRGKTSRTALYVMDRDDNFLSKQVLQSLV
jgi:hypothetical protein